MTDIPGNLGTKNRLQNKQNQKRSHNVHLNVVCRYLDALAIHVIGGITREFSLCKVRPYTIVVYPQVALITSGSSVKVERETAAGDKVCASVEVSSTISQQTRRGSCLKRNKLDRLKNVFEACGLGRKDPAY